MPRNEDVLALGAMCLVLGVWLLGSSPTPARAAGGTAPYAPKPAPLPTPWTGSVSTVAYTVELVPRYRPYDDGVGYAYALLTVVPSLFWDRHPSVARGVPSAWLIETIDPYTAAQGGSIGYSFVADAFLNFGALGVPLFSLLLGWGMVRFWRWADGRVGRLAVVATFVPHLLFSARAEIDVLPRPLVWYGFVPYALYLLIRRSIEERRPSSVAPRAA